MAKFAQVGYGSKGEGIGNTPDGYTYVVNDNVRTGDIIQVISTSRAGKKFATTGVPLHTYKETSKKGQMAKQEAMSKTGQEPTRSYTGKEVGASGSMGTKPLADGHRTISQYQQSTRAGNIAMYKQQDPNAVFTEKSQQTFDEYSKQFIKKGDQQ